MHFGRWRFDLCGRVVTLRLRRDASSGNSLHSFDEPVDRSTISFVLRGSLFQSPAESHRALEDICQELHSGWGFTLGPVSPERLIDIVLNAVDRGELVASQRKPPPLPVAMEVEKPKPAQEQTPPPEWIEIRVVWDETGEPISGLSVAIQPCRDQAVVKPTDKDGCIKIEPIPPGPCEVRCGFAGQKHEDCVAYVGTGDVTSQQAASAGSQKSGQTKVMSIVTLEVRKVRTNDTLEKIAASVGLSWQDLAYFNCGSKSPNKINVFLSKRVGCTHKTKDKQNYMFDDSDDPGLLLVPKKWGLSQLSTGTVHTIRVARIQLPRRRVLFSA